MENLTQILKKQSEKEEPPTQGQERERIRELILEYDGNEKRLTGPDTRTRKRKNQRINPGI
ncbi:MAG: hypothetical protein COV85_02350 [Candidatus Portnoybacteria bacterium CG11_big_fil_rev_8_21_14_0_20_44_10]|uniref:Uncharacterized protein n=1 Tax=Candidatus Portnoybacteria bacterium CG11_big_fil_rev_8_21_14_0_20_44_10 TaxID=1974818 RepID=A0A2H0KQG5_9BACT|nr:MAG: hypothetical protein COV85_02350 [Candidatus Portnoybacteria bacterium CG11_big_fil_rev_8_21_14_0_20_44_10]